MHKRAQNQEIHDKHEKKSGSTVNSNRWVESVVLFISLLYFAFKVVLRTVISRHMIRIVHLGSLVGKWRGRRKSNGIILLSSPHDELRMGYWEKWDNKKIRKWQKTCDYSQDYVAEERILFQIVISSTERVQREDEQSMRGIIRDLGRL